MVNLGARVVAENGSQPGGVGVIVQALVGIGAILERTRDVALMTVGVDLVRKSVVKELKQVV